MSDDKTFYLCGAHGADFAYFYLRSKKKLEAATISSLYDGKPAKCDYLNCNSTTRHSIKVGWTWQP